MIIDEMEITQHRERGKNVFRLGFKIDIIQSLEDEVIKGSKFELEEVVKRRMRHQVKNELIRVFIENTLAELGDRHMYARELRLGSAIYEHPEVKKGFPITLMHPADMAELLQKYAILDDFFEWKAGEFTK